LRPELRLVARNPPTSAILLDFDGTLSEIVARPELARPADGARAAVAGLVPRYGLVAVVSGRPTEEVRELVAVEGVRYLGHYGAGTAGDPLPAEVGAAATEAATPVPEAWPEDKGSSVAVHYRQAPDPGAARSRLLPPLRRIADRHGLEVIEGKMVFELVRPDRPRKGHAVLRLAREARARAALFAGDDLADLEAFAALDALRGEGVETVKVAVRGSEVWPELIDRADLVVDGPAGLVALLRELAEPDSGR
jgi:trehalose 6-phosphate phosphatase